MKGIFLLWCRGRIFLFLPAWRQVSESWFHKRSPGRNLGEHRSVRRSGTASRGNTPIFFSLCKSRVLGTLSCACASFLEPIYSITRLQNNWKIAISLLFQIESSLVHLLFCVCVLMLFLFFFVFLFLH